jgi:hypothetical protein
LGWCWRWNSWNWKDFWDVFDANARGCRGPGCQGVTVWSWRWEATLVDVGHVVRRRRKVQVIIVVICWKIFKKNLNCLMLSYETLLIQLKLLNVTPFEKGQPYIMNKMLTENTKYYLEWIKTLSVGKYLKAFF